MPTTRSETAALMDALCAIGSGFSGFVVSRRLAVATPLSRRVITAAVVFRSTLADKSGGIAPTTTTTATRLREAASRLREPNERGSLGVAGGGVAAAPTPANTETTTTETTDSRETVTFTKAAATTTNLAPKSYGRC